MFRLRTIFDTLTPIYVSSNQESYVGAWLQVWKFFQALRCTKLRMGIFSSGIAEHPPSRSSRLWDKQRFARLLNIPQLRSHIPIPRRSSHSSRWLGWTPLLPLGEMNISWGKTLPNPTEHRFTRHSFDLARTKLWNTSSRNSRPFLVNVRIRRVKTSEDGVYDHRPFFDRKWNCLRY